MVEIAINIILFFILLIIVPYITGGVVCNLLNLQGGIAKYYAVGTISVWAFCQLISVPIILAKGSFLWIVIIMSLSMASICLYGIIKKKYQITVLHEDKTKWYEKVSFIIMYLAIGSIILLSIALQHMDKDDSRFVVNAVDIWRTNRMFLVDPATGSNINIWTKELIKDVTSPWAVYIALCAKLVGTHPTIMAHTFLPIALMLFTCAIYWLLSEQLIGKKAVYRCMFVCFAILINIYGYYSLYNVETFMMTRIWQGKSVVACACIPMFFLISMWIHDDCSNKRLYILLFILALAMCLPSGMGIIIGAMMSGCIGLAYGISNKKITVAIGIWLSAVPGAVYYVINSVI